MAGGAELDLPALRSGAKSLLWATLIQSTFVLLVVATGFVALHHFMSFTVGLSTSALIAIALLWGTLAVSRSPAATLGILAQTRAKGPLTTSTLAIVMTSDVVVLLLMAFVMTIARPLIDPSVAFSLSSFGDLGHSILGSIAIGTTLGLLLALYIKVVGRGLIVVLLALGFGASEILDYLGFEPLLSFLVAGFVVRNLSSQGAQAPDRDRGDGQHRLRRVLRDRRRAPGSSAGEGALADGAGALRAAGARDVRGGAVCVASREGSAGDQVVRVVGARVAGGVDLGAVGDRGARVSPRLGDRFGHWCWRLWR